MSNPQEDSLKVAYVVPMGNGLHSFVFREIRELRSCGVDIHIFPTKVGDGPYGPSQSWPIHAVRPLPLVVAHLRSLVQRPAKYLEVLREAVVLGGLLDFALGVFFAESIFQLDLSLIHCHFGDHKLFVGYFCSRLTGKPLSVTIHAYELYNNPNPRLFRHVLEHITAIVTIADYNQAVLEDVYRVPRAKISVIPLFTDLPELSASPATQHDKIVVLTVARLVEKKGHRTLLEALARLPESYEAWIVGSGPLNVAAMAARLNVAHSVKILGKLSDSELQNAYRAATIFCLPSQTARDGDREGIPVAMMEAMAHGLPVVATRHAGIPELVSEVLVEEGDAGALAAALERVGRDPELRRELARRNREIVATRFSRGNTFLLKALFERIAA